MQISDALHLSLEERVGLDYPNACYIYADLLLVSDKYQLSASFHYRAPALAVVDGFVSIAIHVGIEGGVKVGSESP